MDPNTLSWSYDEEALGFGRPRTPEDVRPRGLSGGEKLGWGLLALGLLSLVLQAFGSPWNGTWAGFLSSFGLLAAGGVVAFQARFRSLPEGIRHDGTFFRSLTARGILGWVAGVLMTALYVLLYFEPGLLGYEPAVWGAEGMVEPARVTGGPVRTVEPLAHLLGVETSQWFLYGVLYTLAILVFGARMLVKYRHSRYHRIRTGSVMLFQTLFAWYLPQLLVRFQRPYVEFNGVWPLKYDYLWPEKAAGQLLGAGTLGVALLVFVVGGVLATPILTYFYGKRWYCSWVCGCGGLAETLGDPWRQLSDKSTRAWRIERWMIHGVLVFVVLVTALLWIDWSTTGNLYGSWSGRLRSAYGFWIGAVFSGVVGVGFYPLLGSRVWCRFGCPQAAILGIFQRCFSRFRITTNGGQCMSCGNCSTYCEMGIDVRAYAQRGDNVVRASCVGCGVCAAVCPRGVLRLENGAPGDRFEGAEHPLGVLRKSLREAEVGAWRPWEAPADPQGAKSSSILAASAVGSSQAKERQT